MALLAEQQLQVARHIAAGNIHAGDGVLHCKALVNGDGVCHAVATVEHGARGPARRITKRVEGERRRGSGN